MKHVETLGRVANVLCRRNKKLYSEFILTLRGMYDEELAIEVLEWAIELSKGRMKKNEWKVAIGNPGRAEESNIIGQGERSVCGRKKVERASEPGQFGDKAGTAEGGKKAD